MLTKPRIKTGFSGMSHSVFQSFTQHILSFMDGNLAYSTPLPALVSIATLLATFSDALTAYGTSPGNRGTTVQRIALDNARAALEIALTQLAFYCENTTPYDAGALASGGWDLTSESAPVGIIGPVRDIVSVKGDEVGFGEAVIKWKKPLDILSSNVKGYNVYRGLTANLSSATFVATVTRTRFKDTGLTNAAVFYYIYPIGTAGQGVVSDVCVAYVTTSI